MSKKCRKQIAFDLKQDDLKAFYPKPKVIVNPQYYKKAYKDIKNFMLSHEFQHRQGSVYVSENKLKNSEIVLLMEKMAERMPWLGQCVEQLDVTDIGKQHSLLFAVANDEDGLSVKVHLEKKSQDKQQDKQEPKEKPSLASQLAKAKEKSAEQNKSTQNNLDKKKDSQER